MNLRPRCREWLPLATQQLRLRNLARIQGLNIECSAATSNDEDDEVLIYYTLHADSSSMEFYTSEALPQRHQQQKWAEICAGDEWRKSNSQCVCVKVWARYQATKRSCHLSETESAASTESSAKLMQANKEPMSTPPPRLANVCLTPNKLGRPPELLFSWGVYFSGLIPLVPLALSKCRANCLIFQLNGEQFTSPALVCKEGLQEQLHLNYERYAAKEPQLSSVDQAGSINSPQVSRSSSPVRLNPERELLRMTTTRYVQLTCEKRNVRQSYDLDQLLGLQRLQRLYQQKMRDLSEICTDITQLSMHCITRNELGSKPRTTSLSGSPHSAQQNFNHSMGRKLSVLLAESKEIAPITLYKAQQLTKQIEALRCKQRLLQTERASFSARNEQHKQRLHIVRNLRIALEEKMATQQNQLEQQCLELHEHEEQQRSQRESRRHIIRHVERRMSTLVTELHDIYNMESINSDLFSICNIAFPRLDQYASDARQNSNSLLLESLSPVAFSAALGYVAHLVQMLAIIMDRPLRNPIVYEPSRARIADEIKELNNYSSHEFPLYTRSVLPSQQTKYAIYLLKQNVAQLCFDITGRCDLRNTFGSLLDLFKTLRDIERSQRPDDDELDATDAGLSPSGLPLSHVNGLAVASNQHLSHLSESHSSVDMNHVPIPTMAPISKDPLLQLLSPGVSQSLGIEGCYASSQRTCRSVGSYSDGEEDFRPKLEHSYSNSDSNIQLNSERR